MNATSLSPPPNFVFCFAKWAARKRRVVFALPTPCVHNNFAPFQIRQIREKKGLSQDWPAKLADVANNAIIKIEQGENINPRLDTLKKIAKALVSVDELINWFLFP